MLLDENLLDKGSSNYTDDDLLCCLENVLTAHFEGKHIIIADLKTIKKILIQKQNLSQRAQRTLNQISLKSTQYKNLKNQLICYVHILPASYPEIKIEESEPVVIHIPLWYFQDSASIQETILLTENKNDAQCYTHLVNFYSKKSDFKGINSKLRPQGGGGSTLKNELITRCGSKRFCLSIIDSDRWGI